MTRAKLYSLSKGTSTVVKARANTRRKGTKKRGTVIGGNNMPIPLKLNLQYFSEESHPFAEAPAPVEPHPFAQDPGESSFSKFTDVPNPLLVDYQADTPSLQSDGTIPTPNDQGQETPSLEELDFGGRKVPVVDPIITELHKDYSHLTKTYQQTNQELVNARQLAEQWQQLAQQNQQSSAQPSTPQQNSSTNISEERLNSLNEEYMEKMYENKFEADKWWNEQPEIVALTQERQRAEIEALVSERLAPIEQERIQLEAQKIEMQFRQDHPDFEDYRDSMQEILDSNPSIGNLPDALEWLYMKAKTQSTPAAPTIEDMLMNPQYQQQILQDENILNMAFQKYQEKKMNTNQNLPNLMGSPVGTQTPMSAGESAPRTLAEATRNWLRSTGQ